MKQLTEFAKLAGVAALLAIGSALLGTAIYDMIKGPFERRYVWFFIGGLIVFWAAFACALRLARRIVGSSAREIENSSYYHRRFLIMGLSDVSDQELEQFPKLCADTANPFYADSEIFSAAYGDPKNAPRNRWQQNVRAIHAHGSMLRSVYILPSDKSAVQVPDFIKGVKPHYPHIEFKQVTLPYGEEFRVSDDAYGMDYLNYRYVHDGLKRAIRMATKDHGAAASPDNICIDVTAGQKTFSIAGAIVTLNNDILLSYMTNEGKPKFYDMSASFGGASV